MGRFQLDGHQAWLMKKKLHLPVTRGDRLMRRAMHRLIAASSMLPIFALAGRDALLRPPTERGPALRAYPMFGITP